MEKHMIRKKNFKEQVLELFGQYETDTARFNEHLTAIRKAIRKEGRFVAWLDLCPKLIPLLAGGTSGGRVIFTYEDFVTERQACHRKGIRLCTTHQYRNALGIPVGDSKDLEGMWMPELHGGDDDE